MPLYKQYPKLTAAPQYDTDAAEELAEVMNELREIEKRVVTLRDIVEENHELQQYLWTTADGKTAAVHNLEDDHLKNILQWQVNHNRPINKALKGEARKRGFDIPTEPKVIDYDEQRARLAASITQPPIDLDDIPF